MAAPANEHCFTEPHWRVIAQGFQTETWFNDGQAVGTGGIRNPQPISLRTGNCFTGLRRAVRRERRSWVAGGGSISRTTKRLKRLPGNMDIQFAMLRG